MDGSSVGGVVAVTAAISAPVTAILTLLLTRGVDAWIKVRKDRHDETVYEDAKDESEYKFLIAELKAVITTMQAELKASRVEHIECVKNHGILEGRVMQMEFELSTYRKLAQPQVAPTTQE